jgi:CO/xanthine dehydrogenase FAD-binding subunit
MRSPFAYHRPGSLAEAVVLKSRFGAAARFWAGGTDLMLLWQRGDVAFDHCIDLTFLGDAKSIETDAHGIHIGAMATLDALEQWANGDPRIQALADAARLMCTPQTRTIATVGGNICHGAPSADLPPPLIALGAQAHILGPDGERELPLDDFFLGVNETALDDAEVLVAITLPIATGHRAASYRRVARTVVDIALTGSAVALTANGGEIAEARVVLGAVAPIPLRSRAAEDVLRGISLGAVTDEVLAEAGRLAASDSRPISDIRAGAAYRREMCAVLTRRAASDCIAQLRGATT